MYVYAQVTGGQEFPTENSICRDDGGGGNRTRELFPPTEAAGA